MRHLQIRCILYRLASCLLVLLLCSSCATVFTGGRAKVTLANDNVREPVNIAVDNKYYPNVFLPHKVKVKRGYRPSSVTVTSNSYETLKFQVKKTFNGVSVVNIIFPLGFLIDAATGAITKPTDKYFYLAMQPKSPSSETPSIVINNTNVIQDQPSGKAVEDTGVSRDRPGQSDLENIIIRWSIDSDPRGARVYWRVISSIPHEVKNTNETYLMTTPYEETRAFNILGLTYANSHDVQVEIKVQKRGYEDQIKRFNVRQAIDQQEISTFFELVPKEGYVQPAPNQPISNQ